MLGRKSQLDQTSSFYVMGAETETLPIFKIHMYHDWLCHYDAIK